MSAPPAAMGSSAVKGCRPARISCANPAALPRTTTSFMPAIVSTPVQKGSLPKILCYAENVTLSATTRSTNFWLTDKARLLKEQRRYWADGRLVGSHRLHPTVSCGRDIEMLRRAGCQFGWLRRIRNLLGEISLLVAEACNHPNYLVLHFMKSPMRLLTKCALFEKNCRGSPAL